MSGSTLSASYSTALKGLPLGYQLIASKLSSAHVYLRQPEEQPHGDWESLPAALVNDAAQLVKANSIEGESGLGSRCWLDQSSPQRTGSFVMPWLHIGGRCLPVGERLCSGI